MHYSEHLDLTQLNTTEKIQFLKKNINYWISKNVFDSLMQILELKEFSELEIWKDDEGEIFPSFSIELPDNKDCGHHPNNILEELGLPEIEDLTFSPLINENFVFTHDMTFETFLTHLSF